MESKKNLKISNFTEEKGFVTLLMAVLILVTMTSIGISMAVLIMGQHKISANILKSTQSYWAAESGIEDALLRLGKNMKWSSPYTLNVGDGSTAITISDIVGGSRTIISEGNVLNRIRKISVVYEITSEKISFYYGAQVGDGGIQMQDTAKIEGNVFSNGSIVATANTEITGTVKVAKTGNHLEGATIGEDAYVDICQNSNVSSTLTCSTSTNCTAPVIEELTEEITTTSLPISQSQIDQWKEEAKSGGTIGDYTLSGKQKVSLGPQKIEGKLTVQDTAKLTVTGTVWVTGEIVIQNSAQVFLDKNSYGSLSGVIITDSKITVQDTPKISGSGEVGSYLMLLSTLFGDPAIVVQNSPELDIIYTSQGRIQLQDSIKLRQVSGWGLRLQNKAHVIYELGLQDSSFSSGPGGSWQVTSWREIE